MKRLLDPWAWILGLATLALRVPFGRATLYDFDAAAFAHAVHDFDVLRFHPHPPGYTGYVLAAKAAALVAGRADLALVWLSHLGAAASTVALYALGRALLDRRAAVLACCLWIASPLAWTYGAVAGTYIFGALGAILVAHACWARIEGGGLPVGVIALGAGLAGSFRPDVPIVTAPLIAWAALAGRRGALARLSGLAAAALGGALGLALWVLPAALSTGSFEAYAAAVARQGETVAFSNAQDRWSWLLFRGVNVAKLALYGGLALGPAGALLALRAGAGWLRSIRTQPRAHHLIALWALAYAALAVGVAFGQPGMALTALPALCLAVAASLRPGPRLPAQSGTALACAAAFVAAVPFTSIALPTDAFLDARAPLARKVSTELALFTARGIDLVDESFEEALGVAREVPASSSVVLTNVASWSRAEYYLPDRPVASYFAFHGFETRIPAERVGPAEGTFPLPDGTRTVLIVEIDQHGLAVEDAVAQRFEPAPRRIAPGLFALPVPAGPARLAFADGRARLLVGEAP